MFGTIIALTAFDIEEGKKKKFSEVLNSSARAPSSQCMSYFPASHPPSNS